MGEIEARSSPVRKLIIAKKVEVHDREAAGDIHLSADRNDLPQGNADAHAREHHAELL